MSSRATHHQKQILSEFLPQHAINEEINAAVDCKEEVAYNIKAQDSAWDRVLSLHDLREGHPEAEEQIWETTQY